MCSNKCLQAIATFPVGHYVNHRTIRTLDPTGTFVYAFIGDQQVNNRMSSCVRLKESPHNTSTVDATFHEVFWADRCMHKRYELQQIY